ncbi:MAG: prolyl oligopeptidase family serine peptidase [Kiritimatiellae bacterium]|nr:prolyl oligopeptidase family serine peptidase [Kiritimatiellia bacterium]
MSFYANFKIFGFFAVILTTLTGYTTIDWAAKDLGLKSEKFDTEISGRREVDWYRHKGDPNWGGDAEFIDRFAVAKPVKGDVTNSPLLVVLHWRGGGFASGGINGQIALADQKDRVFSAPDDFYILMLDSMRDYNVFLNRTHDEYWWGATSRYRGPVREDIPRIMKGETSCEKRVLDSVEWVIRKYGIDRNRVYLCGNSMGGQATYAIGLGHGEVFAAINANVPATVWFAAARLGFVDEKGDDVIKDRFDHFVDPPICVEWSGIDDMWSRDRDVIVRGMIRRQWPHIVLWGPFGHCSYVSSARLKNDLVERFDWLKIKKNEAYPVFTKATCDDKLPWPFKVWKPKKAWFSGWADDIESAEMVIADGAPPSGQKNAFFRWRNLRDDDNGFEMELYIASAAEIGTKQFNPPKSSNATVAIRRIQSPKLAKARKVRWRFGGASGIVERDENGTISIPDLELTREEKVLYLNCLD